VFALFELPWVKWGFERWMGWSLAGRCWHTMGWWLDGRLAHGGFILFFGLCSVYLQEIFRVEVDEHKSRDATGDALNQDNLGWYCSNQ